MFSNKNVSFGASKENQWIINIQGKAIKEQIFQNEYQNITKDINTFIGITSVCSIFSTISQKN